MLRAAANSLLHLPSEFNGDGPQSLGQPAPLQPAGNKPGHREHAFQEDRVRLRFPRLLILLVTITPLLLAGPVLAQSSSGGLRGQVLDPSGAGVPGATVSVLDVQGRKVVAAAKTNGKGSYVIRGLAPGVYRVQVIAPNFTTAKEQQVTILAGRVIQINISLAIAQQVQKVTVSGEATHLNVNPENNASQLVLKGSALQALSDDPDEMQSELEALAGPAAGPNGAQIYIDGFTGGQMPPKSDILEIHINQNPFSAEYDKVGYGRIEIITKPGASQFHGSVFADGNDSVLNSRSPFVLQEPSYHSEFLMGNIGGPISHKASFFFNVFDRDINDNTVVSAYVLNPNNFAISPFSQAVLNPQSRLYITPRLDLQISSKNLLAVRYFLWNDSETNDGIGQFDLSSQAYNTHEREQGLQLMDTQVISSRTVNETRFEYRYDTSDQIPASTAPALDVLGAFTSGGDPLGSVLSTSNYFELQDIATMSLGKHTIIYGGRLRDTNESYSSNQDFNGTFTFPTIEAYQLTEEGLAQGLPFSQIMGEGGGPSQFTISAGNPFARDNLADGSVYLEDQWRARGNLSLSAGARFETQNDISDHADFAPRLGFAWGIGHARTPKTVLRGGFGMFYDRFMITQVLNAEQLNGLNQKSYVVANPDFYPTIPSQSTLGSLANTATVPTAYEIDPSLQSPYTIQSAVGLERQISKGITASVTYLNSHGAHQLLTRNINTPDLGLYNPSDPAYGRPFDHVSVCGILPAVPDCEAGYDGNIFEYEGDGLYNQNELIANFSANQGPVMLFGFYTLNYANSDTSGVTGYVSNPYNILEDYGSSVFDIRDRAVLGGAITLPFGIRLMPFTVWNSGTPYNITLGDDLLGTSILNQRPAFAAAGATGPNIVATSLGTFNTDPAIGQALIPIDYGIGPSEFTLNFHVDKTFGFGKKEEHRGGGGGGGGYHGHNEGLGGRGLSGGGGHPGFWQTPQNAKYNMTVGVSVRNILNNVNLGTPDGNVGSPLFGQSNSLAAGPFTSQAAVRRIDFFVRFTF